MSENIIDGYNGSSTKVDLANSLELKIKKRIQERVEEIRKGGENKGFLNEFCKVIAEEIVSLLVKMDIEGILEEDGGSTSGGKENTGKTSKIVKSKVKLL